MTTPGFDSYSQNGEDVVLWRALKGVEHGRYIDIGANHPRIDSVSMAFYVHGWSGITVEPDPQFARLQREQRPRDIAIEAAITTRDEDTTTLHVVDGTGLSTLVDDLADIHLFEGRATHDVKVATRRLDRILEEAGWQGKDIHFMSVDTEGSERAVLESLDLAVWRPWVLVIEATAPNSTESTRDQWEELVTGAGYQLCLFDGLSCFYVAQEHAELTAALGYGPCSLDNYTSLALREASGLANSVPGLIEEISRWRTQAVSRWARAMADMDLVTSLRNELDDLYERYHELGGQHHELSQAAHAMHLQIAELRQSTSWRATKPLRFVAALLGRARGRSPTEQHE